MLNKFIDFRVFFISLAIGLFMVYVNQPIPMVVYVYPTPHNVDKLTLKDRVQNCFKFKSVEVTCPSDKTKIHNIPVQNSREHEQQTAHPLFG